MPDVAGEAPRSEPAGAVSTRPGLRYHELHRAGRRSWWRSLLGVFMLLVVGLLVLPLMIQLLILGWLIVSGSGDVGGDFEAMLDLENPTPLGLAHLNLVLAGLIPVTFLATWALHGLRPGWLTSVMPRMRWGFFFACLGMSVVALLATLVVGAMIPAPDATGSDVTGELNEFTTQTRDFLLVVLLLTPLQAAGEEYAFRGYLTQVFGSHFGVYAAVVVPALLFALAHGAQDPPIFIDRFAFGLVAGVLVVTTGGLEAGIAMHVLNNWLAFGLALAFGDLGSSLNPTGGTWWSLPVTLTQSLVYLGLALVVAKALGLSNRVDPVVLAARQSRV